MKPRRVLLVASLLAATHAAQSQPGIAKDPPSFAFPISMSTYRITAGFDLDRNAGSNADWTGWKTGDPTGGSGHAYDDHSGTDIGMVTNTQLRAVGAGTVSSLYEDYPADDHSAGGNYMIFSHPGVGGDTYRVNFWHLNYQGALKALNDPVTKGEIVANSDNTGNSTGPHLHLGISKSSETNVYSCGFYHGWWEQDEFYYNDTYVCLQYVAVNPGTISVNVREGTSTSYNVITTLTDGARLVACQKNTWWRVFLPMPPAVPYQAVTSAGSLSSSYAQSGTWLADTDHSSVIDPAADANRVSLDSAGSRYSEFTTTGGADSATFTFQVPQRGQYKVLATFPEAANAANVTYRVAYNGGTSDVLISQGRAASSGGTGTHANPYVIDANPYIVNHTTVGGDDTWNSYTPTGSGIPESGPERVYRLDVTQAQNVTVSVDHAGYPTKDVDVHLLTSLSNTACVARNDFSFSYALTAPGTYYIVADSYGSTNNAATDYTLTVELEKESFTNSWSPVGTFSFDRAVNYTVQVLESTVTGKVDGARPGRVYADAIKIVPVITNRTGWVSNSFLTQINTTTTPVACVVVSADATSGDDSQTITSYAEFPIYALAGTSTTNASPIVGKAVTGQRFVCTGRTAEGWYRVLLTDSTGADEGWIGGAPLTIYHASAAPIVTPAKVQGWRLY